MRVLQLIDSLHPGGAERVAVNIANALVGKIDKSYLCVTREEGLLKESITNGVCYLYLNKTTTLDIKAIIKLSRFIKFEKIEIIHAHSSSFFLATIMRVLNKNLKLVWHDHYGNSAFLKQRSKRVLKFCSRFFNHIFSVNRILASWVETVLKAKRVTYLPNFAIKDISQKVTLLKGENGKRIVCLANLRKQKDHHNLLAAFKYLKETHPDWTLHLVGKDFKDAYSTSIIKYIETENLQDNVFVYGSCLDANAILEQCDIAVLSSSSEGLPIALLEYGLASLPVVVTDVGECRNVVLNGDVAVLVAPKNSKALYKGINKYIENDNYRKDTAKAFNQYISANYSASHTLEVIKQTYLEILNN